MGHIRCVLISQLKYFHTQKLRRVNRFLPPAKYTIFALPPSKNSFRIPSLQLFFLFLPLGARNLHFLNRFEQNNRFKKCTHEASPKNSTLQGASQKKKKNYRGEKQNSPTLQRGINLFTLIYIMSQDQIISKCHVSLEYNLRGGELGFLDFF
jgi:hypothetical protein